MTQEKSKFSFQYTVMNAALDMRRHRSVVAPGLLTKAVGVDGRFSGAVRRFPGMARLGRITFGTNGKLGGTGTALIDVAFFKHVSIQKGDTADQLRGFIIVARPTGTATWDTEFHYYDTNDSAWHQYVITATDFQNMTAAEAAQVDVTTHGKFAYLVQWNKAPRVIYYDGTVGVAAVTDVAMGAGGLVEGGVAAPTQDATTTTGGVLSDGAYLVAVRYWDQTRNVFSALSAPLRVSLSGGTDTQWIWLNATITETGFLGKTVEIYRTISTTVAGDVYSGGTFFKVGTALLGEGDLAEGVWTFNMGKTTADNMNDYEVAQQPMYDRALEEVLAVPKTGRITSYQGVTFLGGTPEAATGKARAELRWSPLHKFQPESFPSENRHRLPSGDMEVVAFQEVGDYLYVATQAVLYRFQRNGTQLMLGRMHFGKGVAGRFAVGEVDESLLIVSPSGVMMVKGGSGAISVIGAMDRLVMDDGEWGGSLSNVSVASDGGMAGTFLLNPDKDEAAVIWHNTNSITTLEDCNFAWVASGVNPTTGTDVIRAFFITDTGLIVYPDAYRANTKATMLDVGGTVNGALTSTSTTTLDDTGAAFYTTGEGLKDCFVHILSGDQKGESREITSNTGTQVTWATSLTLAVGDRYSISPIPFRLRYWPLSSKQDRSYPRDLFRRWNVSSMGVALTGLSVDADSDNDFWDVGVYRQGGSTMAVTAAVGLSENPADSFGAFQADGLQVEPGVEQLAANTEFELTGVLINGKVSMSREVTAS